MRSGDRSVDVYIRKLRVKLANVEPDWIFIHTHFGFGYRLAAVRKREPRRDRRRPTRRWELIRAFTRVGIRMA